MQSYRTGRYGVLTAGAAWLAFAQPVDAQTQGGASPASPAAATGLGEIVVTAQKRSENLQSTPIAVTALNGAALAKHGITAVSDLGQHVPSLTLRAAPQDGLSTVITIRGQSQQEIYLGKQPSVGLYYDGVYTAGTAGTLAGNLLDIERVEVLRGPQGTLYGRNTTGGSINIITNLPTKDFSASLTGEGGTYGLYNFEGIVNVPVSDTIDVRVAGQYLHQDGFGKSLNTGRPVGDQDDRTARVTLRWRPSPAWDIVARGEYSHAFTHGEPGHITALVPGSGANIEVAAELGLPFTEAGLAQARQQALASLPSNPYDVRDPAAVDPASKVTTYSTSLTTSFQASSGLTLKSITAYRDSDKSIEQNAEGIPFTFVTYIPAFTTQAHSVSQEFQANGSALANRLKFVSGLYYDHFNGHEVVPDVVLPAINPSSPLLFDNRFLDTSYAIYAQATYSLTSRLSLTGGFRYTWEKNVLISRNHSPDGCLVPPANQISGQCLGRFRNSFDEPTYSAGINYQVTPKVLLYAKLGRGFKAGGQNEFGSGASETYQPFRPEFALTYEAGVKSQWLDNKIRANLAGFYTVYTDIQRTIYINIPGGIGNVTANAASAHIPGFEAELTALPVPELELSASLSYLDPRYRSFSDGLVDRSGDAFPGVAKWQASGSATYTIPESWGNLSLTLGGYYQTRIDYDPDNHTSGSGNTAVQGGYFLMNAQIGVEYKPWKLQVSAYVKNLTDKRYFSGGIDLTGQIGVGYNYYAPPRTAGVRVTKQF